MTKWQNYSTFENLRSNKLVPGPPEKIPPWASEYTDGIGHTAQLIMKQRLLCPSKKRKA